MPKPETGLNLFTNHLSIIVKPVPTIKRKALSFVLTCIACSTGTAAVSFDFDFSGAVAIYNDISNSLVIEIEDVASGTGAPAIDLRVESISPYFPRSDDPPTGLANNGTAGATDDMRIHLGNGGATHFRFSLYDGTVPGSFSTLYDPGENFAFRLVVYDLDGDSTAQGGADYLTVTGPFGYAVSASSNIQVTDQGNGDYLFEADGVGEVAGQVGIQNFTTGDGPNQLPISVYYEFNNISSFEFEYAVPNTPTGSGSGRNLLFDGDDISLGDFGPNTSLTYVPEPSAFALILGLAGIAFSLNRRAKHGSQK